MRSRKESRTAHIAKALAKAGLSTGATLVLGPGGGIAGVAVGELVDQAIGMLGDKKRKRIEQFHADFLLGTPGDQRKLLSRIKEDETAAAEYATILEKVAQDDEEAKTELYAKLLRFLLHSSIESAVRRHLIRSVREFAFDDFQVLVTLTNIGGKAQEKATINEQVAHLERQQKYAKRGDPLVVAAIQRLEHAGFIGRTAVWDGDQLDVTVLGKLLLEVLG